MIEGVAFPSLISVLKTFIVLPLPEFPKPHNSQPCNRIGLIILLKKDQFAFQLVNLGLSSMHKRAMFAWSTIHIFASMNKMECMGVYMICYMPAQSIDCECSLESPQWFSDKETTEFFI